MEHLSGETQAKVVVKHLTASQLQTFNDDRSLVPRKGPQPSSLPLSQAV